MVTRALPTLGALPSTTTTGVFVTICVRVCVCVSVTRLCCHASPCLGARLKKKKKKKRVKRPAGCDKKQPAAPTRSVAFLGVWQRRCRGPWLSLRGPGSGKMLHGWLHVQLRPAPLTLFFFFFFTLAIRTHCMTTSCNLCLPASRPCLPVENQPRDLCLMLQDGC